MKDGCQSNFRQFHIKIANKFDLILISGLTSVTIKGPYAIEEAKSTRYEKKHLLICYCCKRSLKFKRLLNPSTLTKKTAKNQSKFTLKTLSKTKVLKSIETRQVYNLFQDLWN